MNKYTSLKTSKQLKEWGCDLETNYAWDIKRNRIIKISEITGNIEAMNLCFTYDLLWDICIKYPKEFFGETSTEIYIRKNVAFSEGESVCEMSYIYFSKKILELLQQNKIKEAEEYILENTIFNPKNN